MREKIFTGMLTLVVWGFVALHGPWQTSAQETVLEISEPTSAETTKSAVEEVMKAGPTGIIELEI